MGKTRSPNRDKAFKLYKEHNGNITSKNISEILDEKITNIYKWKKIDEWDIKTHKKVGAPKGNKNAIGKKGGAPKGNLNNLQNGDYYDHTKHSKKDFLKKFIPKTTQKIIEEAAENKLNSLDILWINIQLQLAAIVRSQKIMNVKNNKEMIKEIKKTKVQNEITDDKEVNEVYREEEFEFQFSWDRQATFLNAQSKAITTLQNLISKYEEILHKDWDMYSEEQKVRLDKLKLEVNKLSGDNKKQKGNINQLIEVLKKGPADK